MAKNKIVILGCGITGLTLAHEIITHIPDAEITIVDSEPTYGLHTSGRNSGVLHSGLYYQLDSLKATVCAEGNMLMHEWAEKNSIQVNRCGKLVIPNTSEEDSQLDILYQRAVSNNCVVDIVGSDFAYKKYPGLYIPSGRALWSPMTSVVNPKLILDSLVRFLEGSCRFIFGCTTYKCNTEDSYLETTNGDKIRYTHLFNATGLYADRVAEMFGVDMSSFQMIPFKGLYWSVSQCASFTPPSLNIYPVPNLELPFLGVHFTPSYDQSFHSTIGPTATFALGRKNYRYAEEIEVKQTILNIGALSKSFLLNRGGFRKYVLTQLPQSHLFFAAQAAQRLVPSLPLSALTLSNKVGIRPQLFNRRTGTLINDFICTRFHNTTHILNSISPAFTSGFALARLILSKSGLVK